MAIRTFPSGMILDLREMEGDELIYATEQARKKDGAGALFGCMPRCIVRVEHPGPYTFMRAGDTAVSAWQRILIGDALAGLAFMRELSVPNGEVIDDEDPHKCVECGTINYASFAIAKLRMKALPQASFDRLVSGNPWFSFTDAAGTIHYELPRVAESIAVPGLLADINKALKATGRPIRTQPTAVESVALTLRAVDGEAIADPMKRWELVCKMGTRRIFAILANQARDTCGVELEDDLICREPTCKAVNRIPVPLAATVSIFSPGKERLADASASSSKDTSSSASIQSSGAPTAPDTSPIPAKN